MNVISLGAGVQSSTIAIMAHQGIIDIDFAVFADTGWEPQAVYDWVNFLKGHVNYEIFTVTNGNIKEAILNNVRDPDERSASVPFFLSGGGLSMRQCSVEYKVNPVNRFIRERLGYKKRQRIPAGSVDLHMGISIDEITRVKPSRFKWVNLVYPLIDMGMSRSDCAAWLEKNGYYNVPSSSCIGCPFHSNQYWQDMKRNRPDEFNDAVMVDEQLRVNADHSRLREKRYMHRSLKPLSQVNFGDNQATFDLFDEDCDGVCGV